MDYALKLGERLHTQQWTQLGGAKHLVALMIIVTK